MGGGVFWRVGVWVVVEQKIKSRDREIEKDLGENEEVSARPSKKSQGLGLSLKIHM